MKRNYATIGDFGSCLLVNNQYGYDVCMFDGIDKAFAKGPGPIQDLGPGAPNCQAFLAEQCAIDWNANCEIFYRTHNDSNQRWYPNSNQAGSCQAPGLLGDSLLRNAAEIRFFDGSSTGKYREPLDPTNYSSPIITKFSQKRQLEFENLTRNFDKNLIDSDSIMCRLLQRPKPFLDLLEHIYKHVLKNINNQDDYIEQWDIRGTRTWEALCMLFEYSKPLCPFN
jgi:hypothetical protein